MVDQSASKITDSSVDLAFTVEPNGADTTYKIVYQTGSDSRETDPVLVSSAGGVQTINFTLSGLSPHSDYGIEVVATNNSGTVERPFGDVYTLGQLLGQAGQTANLVDTFQSYNCSHSAQIGWGDSPDATPTSDVTCVDAGHDLYDITIRASHVYATAGTYPISILTDIGNRDTAYARIGGRSAGPGRARPRRRPRWSPRPRRPRHPQPRGPTPVAGQTVVVAPAGGTVLIKVKGTNKYIPLTAGMAVPFGSQIDTTKGKITLTSIPSKGAAPQTATFYDGIFTVTQTGNITNLVLSGPLAACPKKGHAAAAAKKPKTRRLWGSGKGNFRTTGKYSAATIRGTTWLVQDSSCDGTLTRVKDGVVSVLDNVKHKTFLVKAPHKYIAKPRH